MTTKNASFYLSNPYFAFLDGYSNFLGTTEIEKNTFLNYRYFFPVDVLIEYYTINTYFDILISEYAKKIPSKCMRRTNFFGTVDLALGILQRLEMLLSFGNEIMIGSKYLSPVAWAYIGAGSSQTYSNKKFESIWDIISNYFEPFISPLTDISPLVVYHKKDGLNFLYSLSSPNVKFSHLSISIIISSAILFLSDLLKNCGPDVEEFFDLFTNDLTVSSDMVDIDIWLKVREKAFSLVTKKIEKIKITIKYAGDNLLENARLFSFAYIIEYDELGF